MKGGAGRGQGRGGGGGFHLPTTMPSPQGNSFERIYCTTVASTRLSRWLSSTLTISFVFVLFGPTFSQLPGCVLPHTQNSEDVPRSYRISFLGGMIFWLQKLTNHHRRFLRQEHEPKAKTNQPHAALHQRRHVADLVLDLVYQLQYRRCVSYRITTQSVRSTDPTMRPREGMRVDRGGGGGYSKMVCLSRYKTNVVFRRAESTVCSHRGDYRRPIAPVFSDRGEALWRGGGIYMLYRSTTNREPLCQDVYP